MVQKNIGYANGDPRNATGRARGVALRPEAAGALDALDFYFQREFGHPVPVLEGMRGIEMQIYYWDRYINRRPGWTVAAVPGTSNHGWGLAVDFGTPLNTTASREHAWTAAHAPLFGWEWTGRNFGEPWHFDFTGINLTADQLADYRVRGVPGATQAPIEQTPPPPVLTIGGIMLLVQHNSDGRIFAVGETTFRHINMDELGAFQQLIRHQGGNGDPAKMGPKRLAALERAVTGTNRHIKA